MSTQVLVELVNLRVRDPVSREGVFDSVSVKRFQRRFGLLIPEFYLVGQDTRGLTAQRLAVQQIEVLAFYLQRVWDSPDDRTKEFRIGDVVRAVMSGADETGAVPHSEADELPPASPFEDAVRSLARAHTHRCGDPECPAPYFLAKRRTQAYCSEKCAGYGQREAKKRWWSNVGADRRRARVRPGSRTR